jgi:hypothetical protein
MSNTEIKLSVARARLVGMALAADTAASADAEYMKDYLGRLHEVAQEVDLLMNQYNEELQSRKP